MIPMAFYVFYIYLLAFLNFFTRRNSAVKRKVKLSFFKTYTGSEPPENVVVVGRHFDNQFQAPILFLISGLATYQVQGVNSFALGLAWAFVISRLIHSFIHLTTNNVIYRAAAYGAGITFIMGMWVNILFSL